MLRISLREPLEAVAKADDLEALVDAFDGGSRDDAIDARRRPAASFASRLERLLVSASARKVPASRSGFSMNATPPYRI